jgi:hypothetical protein
MFPYHAPIAIELYPRTSVFHTFILGHLINLLKSNFPRLLLMSGAHRPGTPFFMIRL